MAAATADEGILDLSSKKLKKLHKFTHQESQVTTTLILDDNELPRLDNIDSLSKLQKLSAVRNQLLRMYGVGRLHLLQHLNLSHNGILTIEGLKDLVHLKWLSLAGNSLKIIEHLNTNVNLEYLDLSANNISHVGNDLACLKNLKELYLHNNKINYLRQCDRILPTSLITLTLNNNNIEDLNEISQLVNLVNLNHISIANNPCVTMGANTIGFDYRPFVINWCLNVKTIDGYVVDAIESLRAEWLYSQGRGRHFRVGDQKELIQYLASVCPLTGETLETEEDRKLRIILSKAQHHQQQLRDQQSNADSPVASPMTRKRINNNGAKNSPRLASRLMNKPAKSPDRMSSSCCSYDNNNTNDCNLIYQKTAASSSSSLMTQSLDPTILSGSCIKTDVQTLIPSSSSSNYCNNEKCLDEVELANNSPLQALSKMVPVPESLMSPDCHPSPSSSVLIVSRNNNSSAHSNHRNHQLLIGKSSSPKLSSRTVVGSSSSSSSSGKTKNLLISSDNHNSTRINVVKSNSPSPSRQRKFPLNKNNNNKQSSILRKLPPIMNNNNNSEDNDDDETSEVFLSKLQTIQMKAEEKQRLQRKDTVTAATTAGPHGSSLHSDSNTNNSESLIFINTNNNNNNNNNNKVDRAAICIQKVWRGYFTRNRNKEVQEMFRTLQAQRAGQYIQQLTSDMETTKAALESERKIQMLQTEAISALWKQMSALQPTNNNNNDDNNKDNNGHSTTTTTRSNQNSVINMTNLSTDNSDIVRELARTCTVLKTQIQQLQNSMQDIVEAMTVLNQTTGLNSSLIATTKPNDGIATQTEIVAVHTPQGDACKMFPFQKQQQQLTSIQQQQQQQRPSSLPLPISQRKNSSSLNNSSSTATTTTTENNVVVTTVGNAELTQYAGSLVDGMIKTVSETGGEQGDRTEINVIDTITPTTDDNDIILYEKF